MAAEKYPYRLRRFVFPRETAEFQLNARVTPRL